MGLFQGGADLPTWDNNPFTLEPLCAKRGCCFPPLSERQGFGSDYTTLRTLRPFMPSPRKQRRSIGELMGIGENCEARNLLIRCMRSRGNGTLGNRN